MLCYVMLCYAVVCYVMLCCVKNGAFCPRSAFSEFCSILKEIRDRFLEYK